MILVVEGVSASGKTTWCRQMAGEYLVPETGLISSSPDRAISPREAGAFWAQANAVRWKAALEKEAATGTAVCDTDPLKLHYVWCLWQLGDVEVSAWREECEATRRTLVERHLGFADAYLFNAVDAETVRRRRDGDPVRKRRNFELHLRMIEPLTLWYRIMAETLSGSVAFELPARFEPADYQPLTADQRFDVSRFDRLIDSLPKQPLFS